MSWCVSEYPIELPVDGSQSSVFLKMGIDFGPFGPEDRWRGANLPPGWRLEVEPEPHRSYILDERGRSRGVIYLKNLIQLRPIRRFNYGRASIRNPDENVRFCLWDAGAFPDRNVIFEESYVVPSRKQHSTVHKTRSNIYYSNFENKVMKWLTDKYPNWESADDYWDEKDEKASFEEESIE